MPSIEKWRHLKDKEMPAATAGDLENPGRVIKHVVPVFLLKVAMSPIMLVCVCTYNSKQLIPCNSTNRTDAAVSHSKPMYSISHKAEAVQDHRCVGAFPLVKCTDRAHVITAG